MGIKENRLLFDGPVKPPEVASADPKAAFEQFKKEGFINPDGSSFNPDTGIYTRAKDDPDPEHTIKVNSLEETFTFRKDGYKPFKEAAKEAAGDKKAGGTAAVEKKTGEVIAQHRTDIELDALKNKMGANFAELMKAFNLEGQNIPGNFTFDKNLNFSSLKEKFKPYFKPIFNSAANLDAVAKLLNDNLKLEASEQLKANDVADFLADIYSSSAVVATKGAFEKKYSRAWDFRNSDAFKQNNSSYDFSYQVAVEKNSGLSCSFTPDATQQFEADYKAFVDLNPVVAPPTAAEKNLRERAHAFRTSIVGKILGGLGIISVPDVPEGETDTRAKQEARADQAFEDALSGKNIFASIGIFFMGGGAMLADGGKSVQEAIAGLDPKYQTLVTSLEKRSPKLLAKMAADPRYKAPVDVVEAATTENIDKGRFAEILKDPSKIPADKNLKLTGIVAVDGLTITLPEGSEMVLPKGKFARINGKQEGSNDGDKRFKGKLAITGDLPEGTLFKGKVQFQTVEQGATAAAAAAKKAAAPEKNT